MLLYNCSKGTDTQNTHKTEDKTMTMTREYFKENVTMAVEIEWDDGYRHWVDCKGSEVDDIVKGNLRSGQYISDIDFCTKQYDEKVKNFLNFVFYNFYHNPNFKGKSLDDVLDKAFGVEF